LHAFNSDFDLYQYIYTLFYRNRIQFAEYRNIGAGSKTNKRVKWLKKLDWTTVNIMASDSFVDNEGWLKIASEI